MTASEPSPLIHVSVADNHDDYYLVSYFVEDNLIASIEVFKESFPGLDSIPRYLLADILLKPYPHIDLLTEFLASTREMDPETSTLGASRWKDLQERAKKLLNVQSKPQN